MIISISNLHILISNKPEQVIHRRNFSTTTEAYSIHLTSQSDLINRLLKPERIISVYFFILKIIT